MTDTTPSPHDHNDLSRVAIWPKRIGLTLAVLAVISFVWPQLTGHTEIAGLDYMTSGRIFIVAAWVPLLMGIVQRTRYQRKQEAQQRD